MAPLIYLFKQTLKTILKIDQSTMKEMFHILLMAVYIIIIFQSTKCSRLLSH